MLKSSVKQNIVYSGTDIQMKHSHLTQRLCSISPLVAVCLEFFVSSVDKKGCNQPAKGFVVYQRNIPCYKSNHNLQ